MYRAACELINLIGETTQFNFPVIKGVMSGGKNL